MIIVIETNLLETRLFKALKEGMSTSDIYAFPGRKLKYKISEVYNTMKHKMPKRIHGRIILI